MCFAICNFLIPIETSRELYDNCGSPYIFSFFLEYVAICCIINEMNSTSATLDGCPFREYPKDL